MFAREKRTIWLLGIALLTSARVALAADEGPRLLWGNVGKLGVGNVLDAQEQTPDVESTPESKFGTGFDVLHGNNSPAGYMLRHGNIIADSLRVTVDGRSLVRNRDYYVDVISGGISFGEPIDASQTIRVSYRYVEGKSVARSMVGLPLLPSYFGGKSSANFLHAYHASDASAGLPFDVLTFGMKMDFDLGSTGLETMYYVSDPRPGSTAMGLLEKQDGKKAEPVADYMMSHQAKMEIGSGSRVTVGYQDIGANFTGFSTLKEQGTLDPDRVSQFQKERGLRRLSAAFELKPSNLLPEGSPWNRLNWTRVYDDSGSLQAMELTYTTPTAGITAYMRDVAPGFKRLGSLSKDELTQMALATRKQFDPNATSGQVTDADRKAATQEAGLSRNLVNLFGKMGGITSTLSFLAIDDEQGKIAKETLSLAGSSWQAWLSNQEISEQFGKLATLSPSEQQRFGRESGLRRTEAGVTAKIGALALSSDYSQVGGAGEGHVSKASFGLAAKYLNFKANYISIDPAFTRINDLAASAAEKKGMLSDVGFTSWDVNFGGQFSKALKLDTSFARATNAAEALARSSDVFNVQYAPSDNTKLVLQHRASLQRSSEEVLSGAMKDLWSIEQRFSNKWFVSASEDSNLTQAGGGSLAGTVVRTQHFETDKSKNTWLALDQRRMDAMTGKFEHSRGFSLQTRIGKSMTLLGISSAVDRGEDPSEELSKLVLKWNAGKSLNAGLELLQKSTNYAGSGSGYLASLGGKVANRLGPFTNLNVTGTYGSTKLSGGMYTFEHGLKLDAVWGKNVIGLDWTHMQLPNGKRPLARGYIFKSDPDPKKWYHIDLYYKDKDAGLGVLQALRNINADVRLSPTTQLAYTVNQYKELPNGLVELTVSRSMKLTTRLFKNMNLVFDRRHDQNRTAGTDVAKMSFGFQRIGEGGPVVDLLFGMDQANTPTGSVDGRSIRVNIDTRADADRYFTLAGELTYWENSNPAIPSRVTGEARLDYHIPLDL